ncbi:MAG TPA: hypothetical protein VMS99_00260 [Acidimicrobiia bacterium]|nr:hypothetical protein [Acidimicrobiia bacterium]
MSITLSSVKAAYLAGVAEGLSDLSDEDREEVIQDLEAHLAELDDDQVVSTLGDAGMFVAEFRHSAGLDEPQRKRGFTRLRHARAVIEERSARVAEVIQWSRFRPAWIWVRGWLLVTVWGMLYYGETFERFPIPRFGGSSLTGLVLAAVATGISVWLEQGRSTSRRQTASALYSVVAAIALLASLLNPIYSWVQQDFEDPVLHIDRLTGANGEPVENIFAYDLEGHPVEVLLFDSRGRPLRTLPDYVYQEAVFDPNRESFDFGYGLVAFERDQFGRIVPNLYPLELSTYDDYGMLVEMAPPSIGFPSLDEGSVDGLVTVPTTISRGE